MLETNWNSYIPGVCAPYLLAHPLLLGCMCYRRPLTAFAVSVAATLVLFQGTPNNRSLINCQTILCSFLALVFLPKKWFKVLIRIALVKTCSSFLFFSGSCYGGHYHAYIRDVEGLRTWCQPVSRITCRALKETERIKIKLHKFVLW